MVKVPGLICALMMLLTVNIQSLPKDIGAKASGIINYPEISQRIFEMATIVKPVDITISAAGDCTLGYDIDFGYNGSYDDFVSRHGYEYPLRNVRELFDNDDLTIVNLETTLTDAAKRAVKEFKFKGKPEFNNILISGSVEVVNIANNHIHDYLDKGFNDTIANLRKANIGYFGEGNKYIKEVQGIKIGCLGYTGWSSNKSTKQMIFKDIQELKKQCKIVVVTFHWGIERNNYPCSTQKELGRFCIDSGADLILGHHPHVIQGIETYKGKHIVYSMGNFTYGGHKNPADKDTFIFREKLRISGKDVYAVETQVIPCSISSTKNYNNYQPTPLTGDEGKRVIDRLKKYSSALEYGYLFK